MNAAAACERGAHHWQRNEDGRSPEYCRDCGTFRITNATMLLVAENESGPGLTWCEDRTISLGDILEDQDSDIADEIRAGVYALSEGAPEFVLHGYTGCAWRYRLAGDVE